MSGPYPGVDIARHVDEGRPPVLPPAGVDWSGAPPEGERKPFTLGGFLRAWWENYSGSGYIPPGGRPVEVKPGSDAPPAAIATAVEVAKKEGAENALSFIGGVLNTTLVNLTLVALLLIGVWMMLGGASVTVGIGGKGE